MLVKKGKYTGQFRAEVEVFVTHESDDAPSLKTCRYAVLPLKVRVDKASGQVSTPCVIYDRWLNRIADGVYYADEDDACYVAQGFNEAPEDRLDLLRSPNGDALGLVYPTEKHRRHDEEQG